VAVWLACVLGWGLAAVATGHPARQAQAAPPLDRLLPLSAAGTVCARAVVPAAGLVLVCGLTGVLLAVAGGGTATALLCLATAPVWAAAALRAAYRPDIDWSGEVLATPVGPVPVGVGATLLNGVDAGVVGSLPLGAALLTGERTAGFAVAQLVWSLALGAGAVALLARGRRMGR
jgi:hypothetical protein